MKKENKEKEEKKNIFWQAFIGGLVGFLTGVEATRLFYKNHSSLARQNQVLRAEKTILTRRIKSQENRSINNLLRGIKIGEERAKRK